MTEVSIPLHRSPSVMHLRPFGHQLSCQFQCDGHATSD